MSERGSASDNPYQAPCHGDPVNDGRTTNPLGTIGFSLSFVAILGLCTVGSFGQMMSAIGMSLTCLSIPGLLVSSAGLWWRPKRLAAWGVVLGMIGLCYLPTFYFAAFAAR